MAQGHRALWSNQVMQQQVDELHCQLLQLQYIVSDHKQQQAQQHLPVTSEQALVTVRQQQLPPLRAVRDSSDPVTAPSTPELGAGSSAEAHSTLFQPTPDDASNSSSSHDDMNSSLASDKPAGRRPRAVRAVSWMCSAATVAVGIVLSQRKVHTRG